MHLSSNEHKALAMEINSVHIHFGNIDLCVFSCLHYLKRLFVYFSSFIKSSAFSCSFLFLLILVLDLFSFFLCVFLSLIYLCHCRCCTFLCCCCCILPCTISLFVSCHSSQFGIRMASHLVHIHIVF